MYRYLKVEVGAASDSSMSDPVFGPRKSVLEQTKDLQDFSTTIGIAPGAADTQVPISPVVNGYFIYVTSDYPIRVRINGPAATQFILTSNNVSATNVGAPLPDQCAFAATCQVTSLYLQPIVGAAQTARVRILILGDPTSAYV